MTSFACSIRFRRSSAWCSRCSRSRGRATTTSRRHAASRRPPWARASCGRGCASARSSPRSVAMSDCEHLGRTSAYFDGELADAEHADALAHLADCAACQQLLATAVSVDAAVSQKASSDRTERPVVEDALAARRARKRWTAVVAMAGVLAAAAMLLLWLTRPKPTEKVAIA